MALGVGLTILMATLGNGAEFATVYLHTDSGSSV